MSNFKVGASIAALLMAVLATWLYFGSDALRSRTDSRLPLIAITQIATHPALDDVREGIIEGLRKRGFEQDKTVRIIFKNANGDASLTVPIIEEFLRANASLIIPISTPSALAAAKATKTVPIVFSGVTDPLKIGLIASWEKPGGNVTGVSDRWPFELQVTTFLKLFPNARRIGMLYTRGDDVSKIGVESMTKLSTKLGFDLRLVPVAQGVDVYPSSIALLRDVDAIYVGIDHLLLENLDSLVKASTEARKPLFGGESGSVEKGAVMAVSINMRKFGDLTAEHAAKVLRGVKPADIPVAVVSDGELLVNRQAASAFGLDLNQLKQVSAKFYDPK